MRTIHNTSCSFYSASKYDINLRKPSSSTKFKSKDHLQRLNLLEIHTIDLEKENQHKEECIL